MLRQGNRVRRDSLRHGNGGTGEAEVIWYAVVGGIIRHDNREMGELVMWESDVVCNRE